MKIVPQENDFSLFRTQDLERKGKVECKKCRSAIERRSPKTTPRKGATPREKKRKATKGGCRGPGARTPIARLKREASPGRKENPTPEGKMWKTLRSHLPLEKDAPLMGHVVEAKKNQWGEPQRG